MSQFFGHHVVWW